MMRLRQARRVSRKFLICEIHRSKGKSNREVILRAGAWPAPAGDAIFEEIAMRCKIPFAPRNCS